jgi:hypothetical protein
VLLRNGKHECTDVARGWNFPIDAKPKVTISSASDRPTVRKWRLDGVEIHRCVQLEYRLSPIVTAKPSAYCGRGGLH